MKSVTYLSIMLRSMTRTCLKILIFIRKLILWKSAEISNGRLLRCMSAWIGSTLKPFYDETDWEEEAEYYVESAM